MKDKKKQRKKVIPHCYRRNHSRTLSHSYLSTSQLVQLGSYKKRINDLSKNNRHLAAALQESRLEAAVQHNLLKEHAKDCNNILFARLKLNEMAKNVEKFVTDLEEVRSYLNFELLSDKNKPYKRGSPSERIIKQPAINCIEEVSYESSLNEVVVPENVPASSDLKPIRGSGDKVSNVLPSNPENNDENMEIAPILFADDSEGKKSSTKSKISKKASDPDNLSLTPELNIDLTCVKLKRKSSRRQTQFLFPGSRSTSRGKASAEKENIFEELMTPAKPSSPTFNLQQQDAPKMEQSSVKNLESSINNGDIKEKEFKSPMKFPENHLALGTNQCDLFNLSKTVIVVGAQPVEPNQTVHLCEDMELTEVIRPMNQIIVANGLPFGAESLDNANLNCETNKENIVSEFNEEMKNRNYEKEIITERDTQELFTIQPCALKQINDDKDVMQIPKISENDEVQNVGMITFCEPNDENFTDRDTKSSVKGSRRSKPVKYAVFFSSDESDKDSSFEISPVKKTKTVKRKAVISAKSSKTSEKTTCSISQNKVFPEKENNVEKGDLFKSSINVLPSEKNEKNLTKKLKDLKISKSQDDLPKHLPEKCSLTSKDTNLKVKKTESIKKLRSSNENDLPQHLSDKSASKDGNVKKVRPGHGNDIPKCSSDKSSKTSKHKHIKLQENVKVKNMGLNHVNELPKNPCHKSTKSRDENIKLNDDVTVKNSMPNHEYFKNVVFSPISSPGILKKTQSNFQENKEIGSETPLKRNVASDDLDVTITNVIESPKSESRKVSFAPTDMVCKFRKMSRSQKIAENKKERRTSKSVLDFEELLEQEKSKVSHASAEHFSESTNGHKKTDNPVIFNFSGDTELYTFLPPNNNLIAPTIDELSCKYSFNATQESVKKISKSSKKVLPSSKHLKNTNKLSLKNKKDHPKNTEPKLISDEVFKERNVLLFESPVSVSKPTKRKSLFKENLDDDFKENINHQIQDKTETTVQESDKIATNVSTELSAQNNILKKSSSTKKQRKTQGKCSMKKLEPTSEIKKKKSVVKKSLENSPVLKDTLNLPEVKDGVLSKRRSRPVSLKEPNLNKKLRRE